jgi:hypothetical protein
VSRAKSTADAVIAEPTPTIETVTVEPTARPEQIAAVQSSEPRVEQSKHERPNETASKRAAILDALAGKVARNERLPRRITIADEEISTAEFLAGFKFDRQNADSAALQRVAPQAIPNATVCEVVAVIGFYLESQIAKADAARVAIESTKTFKQSADQN